MRVLVNYETQDKPHLPALAHRLRERGIQAVSTALTLTISELLDKTEKADCTAVLLINEQTLRNLVPGERPSLDSYRGSRLNYKIPVLVLNKLEQIYTVKHGDWLLQRDLDKLKKIFTSAVPFHHTVLETVDHFEAAWRHLSRSVLIAYDIETSVFLAPSEKEIEEDPNKALIPGEALITCCSWTGLEPSGAIYTCVLPLIDFKEDHWKTKAEYACALKFMRDVNALPIIKVMQNGCYDAIYSLKYRAPPRHWLLDTMGRAHAAYAELPQTLDFIASYQLYDYIYWKDEAELAHKRGDIIKYWAYNAKDTFYTLRIAIEQLKTLPAYARLNYGTQFPLVYPALYCAMEGILIDQEKRKDLRVISSAKLEQALALLRIMFANPNFNPGSWQQVEKYIYRVFGAKKPKIGKSKSCTDEKNLKAVAEQHPLLAKLTTEILTYKKAQKAIGTYYDFAQINSRLLYSLDPFGTETDRMACRGSAFWVGTQVQNIPKYAKGMLIADEGYELVEIDNSQSEARCTAYLAGDDALITALETPGRDFYRTLGTLFFQIPYEEVTDFFRNKVLKKIVHGTNYMMGGDTFTENIGIQILHESAAALGLRLVPIPTKGRKDEKTIKQFAKDLLEVYHKPFPKIREWYKKVYAEIHSTGKLVSPLGHTRVFFGNIAKDHSMLRGAVAHGPQNLSVAIVNKGLMKVYHQLVLPSNGEFRLKAQVHDSILAQYPKVKRDYYLPKAIELMKTPIIVHGRELQIPVDSKTGSTWADLK